MSKNIPKTPTEYRQWWGENTSVPYGFCWCGCGERTRLAHVNASLRGWIKGEPMKYIHRHRLSKPPVDFGVNTNGGLCQCGCGELTPIAKRTSRQFGLIKGEPVRYINGHHIMLPESYTVEDRGYETPCHIFRNATGDGYGYVSRGRKFIYAHCYFWEREYGPVPDAFDLHHKCRVRNCVRLDHLIPLSRQDHAALHKLMRKQLAKKAG